MNFTDVCANCGQRYSSHSTFANRCPSPFDGHFQLMLPPVGVASSTQDNAFDALRAAFPHGHPEFIPTTVRELQLHSDKNHDYAAGGKPTGNFDRVAAILALYPGLNIADRKVVALVYALKQLDAVLWGLAKGITHKVEGLKDRLQDISVYAKLVMCMADDEQADARDNIPF